jgi:hypothetical protein
VGKQAYSKTEDRSAAAMSTFDDTLPAVQADQTLDFPLNPESASSYLDAHFVPTSGNSTIV